FYYRPQSMREMIDFMVGKVLDAMPLNHDLYRRWGDDGNGQ
ncbi:aromatic acid decarboxylase, partial [Escherichia coli]